jgi:hypothetical protein
MLRRTLLKTPLLHRSLVSRTYHVGHPTLSSDVKSTVPEQWTKLAQKELKDTPLDKVFRKNADVCCMNDQCNKI